MEQHEENIGTKKDLCLYRIQSAKENLKSAKILFAAKEYKGQIIVHIMLYFMQSMQFML